MAGIFRSSPPQINLYNDISFYVPLAWGSIVYSYYKNAVTYVVPPPRKPKVFKGYGHIAKYVFKTLLPVSYIQNVRYKLDLEKDR